MASIAPHQFVCVSPEWGSRTEPPDSLHASPNAAANALKRPVAGLWNGLEPGPILQGPISWPHSVHQLLRSDKRISRSAANSRRPTEAEASHLFGSDPHEALSQVSKLYSLTKKLHESYGSY